MIPADQVLNELVRRGYMLSTAESLTGGLLADAFVSVPGASAVYLGGVVSYATSVKQAVLGVDADLLARHGAVHPDVATQMAEGVRDVVSIAGARADVGVATTGVAGPDPADGQPVGTVYIGISTPETQLVVPLQLSGSRAEIRTKTVALAVDAVGRALGL
ncbi:CinA family protein [Microbacterium sp. NC79]|uniref:CinA family protein n=1 Tax=Microbacterium sp. NC79 TaxID=2851009 RepID=UPI001C2BB71D|nr:CinA family protein [Microbacterium sp. NC79]MBV0895225.1 CinA family protein [Microbacterium sp. NC79]